MTTALLIIIAVFLFGFIIFAHEFGHFITAKLSGIKVNEFSIGMGPKFLSFKKGETAYSLRVLPIGGFCAMEGEDEESDDERAFNNKPVWKRLMVALAGGAMNIIVGLLLALLILCQQDTFATTTIAKFTEDSVLHSAGLQEGDVFYSIDGYRILNDRDISFSLALADPSDVDIKVKRGKEILSFPDISLNSSDTDGQTTVPIDFYVVGEKVNIGTLLKKTVSETVSLVRMVWLSLIGLITGRFGLNEIAGPVGAAQAISQAASAGLETGFMTAVNNIFLMMAVITVNLGIVNLLPLPALDGGRILFLIIEGIRRKPVNRKYEGLVHAAGFALLLGLMVVITFNDLFRLITGHGLGG